ncbi:SDR family NAD(P)-dependent oxidoreductase, partial [Salmonella enterica subsp. enterica serovar Kentucky]|nr:SDR family NAD(P)-dependent oxidoreductase [Salmonella enterica subsp. enterica serovar Kentucky]
KVGSKHNSGYSAAKFGGVGLTQSLALDLAEYGITVHSLMLGNRFDKRQGDQIVGAAYRLLAGWRGDIERTVQIHVFCADDGAAG